ncbi:MAG: ABC transporter permease subunit [Deltaproteobacteria bacterium]|nr:ABC transporter permease subunit [Deltaproteobacteria bacterium]
MRNGCKIAAAAVSLFFLLAVLIFPLSWLFARGLSSSVDYSIWSDPFFWSVVRFTYWQAACSAFLSCVLGTTAAFLYSDHVFPARKLLWHLSLVCFSLPTIVVVLSFTGFFGRSGLMNSALAALGIDPFIQVYGWVGILGAHVFYNFPLFLKSVGSALEQMDRTEEMAALSLGASRLQCLMLITFPKIWPVLKSCFFLAFLLCSSSFLVVLILGASPKFTTLEVAIYEATKIEFDIPLAVRLALVQLVISGIVYFLFLRQSTLFVTLRPAGAPFIRIYHSSKKMQNSLLITGLLLVVGVLAGGPLIALVQSGVRGVFYLGREFLPTLTTTVLLASLVGVLATAIGISLAYCEKHVNRFGIGRWLAYLANIPLSVSTILLSVALMLAYPAVHLKLRGSLLAIAVVQSTIALPLAFRILHEGFCRIGDELYWAAASAGASPFQVLCDIELPLLKGPMFLSFLLAASFSIGEIGAVIMFLSEKISTVPLWIYRAMSQYRFEEAYGAAVVLFFFTLLMYVAAGFLERKLYGSRS